MATLAQYRQALSPELGPYVGPPAYSLTASSGSTTSQLECLSYPIMSSIAQDDALTDRPLYRPSAAAAADKHRLVKTYAPATGLLTPDKVWTNSPNGEAFEVLGPFDAPTLHALINEGLKHCWLVVELCAIPVATMTRHDLSTIAPWLQDPMDVYQVGYLASGESRNQTDPFARVVRGDRVRDGNTLYLDHHPRTFNASDSIYLKLLKRAYDHCRVTAGTYGGQSGLSLETDEAPIDTEWLSASTLVVAWRRFGHLLEAAANQRLIRDRAEAAAWFTDLTAEHFRTTLPERTLRRIGHFGPVHR